MSTIMDSGEMLSAGLEREVSIDSLILVASAGAYAVLRISASPPGVLDLHPPALRIDHPSGVHRLAPLDPPDDFEGALDFLVPTALLEHALTVEIDGQALPL